MALEDLTGTKYIDDLNSSNPAAGDNVSEGDDHIRGIKNTIKLTFPNVNAAVNATPTELNYVDGVTSAIQTQLDAKLPLAGGAMSGNITMAGSETVDGRDLSADGTKLDGIEASADVTDATNVTAAGAGMLTVDQAWTGSQRATLVVDNDGSFDLNAGQNFKCTPAAGLTLTFTNFANGQSGYIILVNSGGHAIARHADSIADANFVTTVSAAGTYIISYISDGTDAFLTNSAIMA